MRSLPIDHSYNNHRSQAPREWPGVCEGSCYNCHRSEVVHSAYEAKVSEVIPDGRMKRRGTYSIDKDPCHDPSDSRAGISNRDHIERDIGRYTIGRGANADIGQD